LQGLGVEDLTMDKIVEILKGKHVSKRGRRPRKVATKEQVVESSSNESESSSISQNSSLTSVSPQQEEGQSLEIPPEKPKRKYVKKAKKKSEKLSKDEVSEDLLSSVNGPDPVIKKRGRGRPRKNVATPSELLLAQVSIFIPFTEPSFFYPFYPLFCVLPIINVKQIDFSFNVKLIDFRFI